MLTIPNALRGLFERERDLLGVLSRAGYDALCEAFAAASPESDGIPGVVASIQTFGSFVRWNVHLHLVVAEGLFTPDGRFQAVEWFDAGKLEEIFRRRVLADLHGAERLSELTRTRLLSWEHSGFSSYGRQACPP